MAKSDQIGITVKAPEVRFPDLARLETELKQRFGTQGLYASAEFALTQN